MLRASSGRSDRGKLRGRSLKSTHESPCREIDIQTLVIDTDVHRLGWEYRDGEYSCGGGGGGGVSFRSMVLHRKEMMMKVNKVWVERH